MLRLIFCGFPISMLTCGVWMLTFACQTWSSFRGPLDTSRGLQNLNILARMRSQVSRLYGAVLKYDQRQIPLVSGEGRCNRYQLVQLLLHEPERGLVLPKARSSRCPVVRLSLPAWSPAISSKLADMRAYTRTCMHAHKRVSLHPRCSLPCRF